MLLAPSIVTDPIQVTLQARLYALYRKSKFILALMVFGYMCEIAALLTTMIFVNSASQSTSVRFLSPPIHSR